MKRTLLLTFSKPVIRTGYPFGNESQQHLWCLSFPELLIPALAEQGPRREAPCECRAGILTVEGNGSLVVLSLLCLLQVQQGGCKQGVVDEVFHVVLLTLLLGFGAHLVGHVLPGAGRGGGFT